MTHLTDFHENHNHSMALRGHNTEFHPDQSEEVENESEN